MTTCLCLNLIGHDGLPFGPVLSNGFWWKFGCDLYEDLKVMETRSPKTPLRRAAGSEEKM